MRVAVFSNYLNAHMLPLCLALRESDDVDFSFVALSGEPGDVGRPNLNNAYDFVIRSYEGEKAAESARTHALEDDLVIFMHMGGDEKLVKQRMRKGLLTFRQAERVLKRGKWFRFFPPKALRTYDWFVRYRGLPYYVLCTGAYAAHDLALAGFPARQCLTWGYFPDCGNAEIDAKAKDFRPANRPLSLMWAGRMIGWKHPQTAIDLAERLHREGRDFRLVMVGDGPHRESLQARVAKAGLESNVSFAGLLKRTDVLDCMRSSDVLLFTSDYREGWGATLNEAMSQGCAVVANAQAGSSLSLVSNGENGLLYDGTQEGLYLAVSNVFDDLGLVPKLGVAAYSTMHTVWSADNAAASFLKTARAFMEERPNPIKVGPCSPAPLFSEGWTSDV